MAQISCPACDAPEPGMLEPGLWECGYCGTRWNDPRPVCPSCGTLNEPEAEVCEKCDEPLTLLSRVFQRHTRQDIPLWLKHSRRRASDVKSRAEDGSLGRMAVLSEMDRTREEAQAAEEGKRKARDRQVLTVSLVFFIVVVCLGFTALVIVLVE